MGKLISWIHHELTRKSKLNQNPAHFLLNILFTLWHNIVRHICLHSLLFGWFILVCHSHSLCHGHEWQLNYIQQSKCRDVSWNLVRHFEECHVISESIFQTINRQSQLKYMSNLAVSTATNGDPAPSNSRVSASIVMVKFMMFGSPKYTGPAFGGFLSYRSQIVRFMGPTWVPPGSCRPQMGPMLVPWTLLSGLWFVQLIH